MSSVRCIAYEGLNIAKFRNNDLTRESVSYKLYYSALEKHNLLDAKVILVSDNSKIIMCLTELPFIDKTLANNVSLNSVKRGRQRLDR